MAEINLSDSKGRDAIVSADSVTIAKEYRWIDKDGAQAINRKVLRAKVGYDIEDIKDTSPQHRTRISHQKIKTTSKWEPDHLLNMEKTI